MTVGEFAERENLHITVAGDLKREITGGYCGDLLSWVMTRAESGDVWFTVMGNINAIAVAVLTDCACILLCDSAALDEDARQKAEEQGVTVLTSRENAFALASRLAAELS